MDLSGKTLPGYKRVGLHIAFWLAYLLYHTLVFGYMRQDYWYPLKWEAYDLPVKILTSYFVAYFLIPKYLFTKRIGVFAASICVTLIAAGFLQRLYYDKIVNALFENREVYLGSFRNPANVLKTVISIYPIVALVALIKVGKHWYGQDIKHQKLQKEKIEAELNFLKSQINPHFLFNTLNSLYALTLKKSDKASLVVLKLSELLNYLLYDSNKTKVPLEKEIELVHTYISLEKIRYGDRLKLSFNVEGDPKNKHISPLLILPFVENSFKHGAGNQVEDVWIDILISIEQNSLLLRIANSKDPTLTLSIQAGAERRIGLQNVRRRLKLLYGENNYTLNIQDDPASYSVNLKLRLDVTSNENENDLLYN